MEVDGMVGNGDDVVVILCGKTCIKILLP